MYWIADNQGWLMVTTDNAGEQSICLPISQQLDWMNLVQVAQLDVLADRCARPISWQPVFWILVGWELRTRAALHLTRSWRMKQISPSTSASWAMHPATLDPRPHDQALLCLLLS